MSKQPYIPLYIGDWEQDTNLLSPLAEFALLKLTFKLFRAEKKGVFSANLRTLSLLFKSNLDQTKEIFQELIENKILEIQEISDGKFEIKSRRMMREAAIAEARSEAGSKGGRGHRNDEKANQKQTQSKPKAKRQQNADNEDEDDNINNEDASQENKGVREKKIEAAVVGFCTPELYGELTADVEIKKPAIPSLETARASVSQMTNWRNACEHYSLTEQRREELFKIFYEQKEDKYRKYFPDWSDVAENFYYWIAKYKPPKRELNRGPRAILEAERQPIVRIKK